MKTAALFLLSFGVLCWVASHIPKTTERREIAAPAPPDDLYLLDKMGIPDEEFLTKRADEINSFKRLQSVYRNGVVTFPGLWTTQGPGNLGGRVNAIAVHPTNEKIIFIGFSHGGAYRTLDGGKNWEPVFDQEVSLYISHIAFDPQTPTTLYIATGDDSGGYYCGQGNGIYKSINLGKTWTYIGLKETRVISEIVVDPKNPQVLYAGALGYSYGKNENRGLYKSNDGGMNWNKILYLNDSSGVTDIAMNPEDPNILYVAFWNKLGTNNRGLVSGPDGQIFKTVDGGLHWKNLTEGLPSDSLNGRIAIALAESNPDILYARYIRTFSCEGKTTNNLYAIYKTTDGGEHWEDLEAVSPATGLNCDVTGGFGWYFGNISVNPTDPDELFLLAIDLYRSQDGGKNWQPAAPNWAGYEVHADKHDLVFLKNGNILLGTDGGLYEYDGQTDEWEDIENIATNQMYRTAFNPNEPDLYYGGAQDNGSTSGNKNAISSWDRIFGGDGFQMAFKQSDPTIYYAEYQNGNIWQYYHGDWRPFTQGLGGNKNWDFPYLVSKHDDSKLLAGSTSVYYNASDTIADWKSISPILVNNGPYPSRSGPTITSLDESPIDPNVLIAGTTNGNLWRTYSFDSAWTNITKGLPNAYISSAKCAYQKRSHFFVTLSAHRSNDFNSYVYKSEDGGLSWKSIQGDLPQLPVYDILVYPERGDSVLFVGNHIGVYATLDGGTHWKRVGDNMPFIEIYDLEFNISEQTLIAASFGKSILSFPLREILKTTVNSNHVLLSRPVSIFPNPCHQLLHIKNEAYADLKSNTYVIRNTFGSIVQNGSLSSAAENVLDVSELTPGIYYIQMSRFEHVPVAFLKM